MRYLSSARGAVLSCLAGRHFIARMGFVAALAGGSGSAAAAGFYLQDQSVKGGGRAYSGEAADMGAESLWWNPASIAGIEQSEIYNGVTGIFVNSTVTDRGSTIHYLGGQTAAVGGNPRIDNPVQNGVLPTGGFAYRINDQWAIGLAMTSPFSFVTKYPTESWTRYAAETSRLTTLDFQPTLAWRPTRWLGLGIGPNIEYQVAALSGALPNLFAGQPDGQQTLHGNGWNVGFNAGLQLHLTDRLTFGAAYRSKVLHELSGKLTVTGLEGLLGGQNFRADGGAHFNTPWAATFGLRWRATDRLTLNAQAVRQGWSVFDAIFVTSPLTTQTNENYHDTLSGAFGIDYEVTPRWIMRTGLQYDPSPTPGPTRDARVPDANRWLFSVGTSLKVTHRITLDASVTYIDFQNSAITRDASAYVGTPVPVPVSLSGLVQASGVVAGIGSRIWF